VILSDSMGMRREAMVFDLLRAGFLIQLEVLTAGGAGMNEKNEREALTDMFVYLRVPQIVKRLVERNGVSNADVYAAMEKMVRQHSLLNEVDNQKWDNSLLHVASELKDNGILSAEQVEHLVAQRRAGLERRPELYKLLANANGGKDEMVSASTVPVMRLEHQQSRLAWMKTAQSAKKVFERVSSVQLEVRWDRGCRATVLIGPRKFIDHPRS